MFIYLYDKIYAYAQVGFQDNALVFFIFYIKNKHKETYKNHMKIESFNKKHFKCTRNDLSFS